MTEPQPFNMPPCPKCGLPVHPENVGFHVCREHISAKTVLQRINDWKINGEPAGSLLGDAADEIERLERELSKYQRPMPYDLALRAFRRAFGYPVEESKQDQTKWLHGWMDGYQAGRRAGKRSVSASDGK